MTQQTRTFGFGGGLDLASAALAVPPGRAIAAMNYEPLAEGYGRVPGYERFDGQMLPSQAQFATLAFFNGGVPLTAGATITGGTSGATGHLLVEPYGVSGDWDASTAAGTLVLDLVDGTFLDGELLEVGGSPYATADGIVTTDSAPSEDLRDAWTLAAMEAQRERVLKVPGTGPVRGVALLKGTLYAWRDQNDTFASMFKATSTGWQEVTGSRTLVFTAGNHELAEGDVVHQGSGSATVHRIVKSSGSYTDGTAAGYLVLTAQTGAFYPGALLNAGGDTIATAGVNAVVRFHAGGRYDVIGHNFYGATNRFSLYGAYGEGQGFEFDGTAIAPISTGMVDDRPTRVAEIAQHLLFAFRGGSIQFSGTGAPLDWQPILGAGEIGLGDDVTDILQANSTAVAIFGETKVAILLGADAETFQLDELSEEAGAEPWTAQAIGTSIYLDTRGLRTLGATQAYGDFKTGTLTELVAPYLTAKQKAGVRPVLSMVSKAKAQYRLFYDDGSGLSVYMGRKAPETLPFDLGDMQPFCGTSGKMADESEGLFVGAEDGYVYRLDSGPSQDGSAVSGFLMLPYNGLGSPLLNKRWMGVSLELVAAPTTRIGFTTQFDYGDGNQPIDSSNGAGQITVLGGGGVWDVSNWGDFFWSAAYEGTASAPTDGFGRNMSLLIGTDAGPLEYPHILQAYHLHFAVRGLRRAA